MVPLKKDFFPYACLPFVGLAREEIVCLGPILFWPASRLREIVQRELQEPFGEYLDHVSQVKTKTKDHSIYTMPLDPKKITCVSIQNSIDENQREFALIDSLYLFYFASIFLQLYNGEETPSFNAFRKLIPANASYIQSKEWATTFISESLREKSVEIKMADQNLCAALGKVLEAIYVDKSTSDEVLNSKRLVRSIRYLVDRFFQRFINLFEKGLNVSKEMFEPEDLIYLTSGFETLFNLNDQQPAADFKHKLRLLLGLKYSRPVEIFWKWVDDFYEMKRKLTRGDTVLDPYFKLNPNFEISHIYLGIKLFVYSVYYNLFKLESNKLQTETLQHSLQFINPEDVVLFFWTELSLLRKLNMSLKDEKRDKINEQEFLTETRQLTDLCTLLYQKYFMKQTLEPQTARFIPTPNSDLNTLAKSIIKMLKEDESKQNPPLMQSIHPDFIHLLEKRLKF